jgi:hypothetical protein
VVTDIQMYTRFTSVPALTDHHCAEAQKKMALIEAGLWNSYPAEQDVDTQYQRISKSKPGLWFDRNVIEAGTFDHRPFSELFSLSSEARESAAPHVRSVYEDVFMTPGPEGEFIGLENSRAGVRVGRTGLYCLHKPYTGIHVSCMHVSLEKYEIMLLNAYNCDIRTYSGRAHKLCMLMCILR